MTEQSDARRVGESWFLKWIIARADRVIRAVRRIKWRLNRLA